MRQMQNAERAERGVKEDEQASVGHDAKRSDIAAYILSGGKNSRMGGKKKLFLEYDGIPFYQRILDACSLFRTVYLSVEAEEPYAQLDMPLVVDQWQGIGPMGGICSGLLQCPEEAIFVMACDMPMIRKETILKFLQVYEVRMQKHRADGTTAESDDNSQPILVAETEDGIHPLFGIYPKHSLPVAQELIEEGNYRMMQLLRQMGYETIRLDEEADVVTNVNTLEELERLQGKNG